MKRIVSLGLALFAALQPCRSALAGGVWIVQGPNGGHHRSIQDAVDAAGDGDILVVGAGVYPSFIVDDKALSILAAEGADVRVEGTIDVKNLAAHRMVLLSGISSTALPNAVTELPSPALRLLHNAGHVRIQGSTHTGGAGEELAAEAGPGAVIVDSAQVSITRCTLLGGLGDEAELEGGRGGDGATVFGSSLALYDSTCRGGPGGVTVFSGGSNVGGRGGDGCRTTLALFASGSVFTGGRGGDAFDAGIMDGGEGGHGLVVDPLAHAQLLAVTAQGGPGGSGDHLNGQPGAGQSGSGSVLTYSGSAKRIASPTITSDESPWILRLAGSSGDQFRPMGSFTPEFVQSPGVIGVQLIDPSFFFSRPAGIVLPPAGALALPIPARDLRTQDAGLLVFLQAWAEGSHGERYVTSPLHKLFLDRRGLPDCNRNGVLDYFDVIEGTSADLDHDLVPDSCNPDCNGNGFPDGYDIDLDPGLDVDRNGSIDDCEPAETLYVDAGAASGGDGSAGNPFRTIREAVEASIDGDTVLVRDGLYVGPRNRNIDLGPRAIAVRSEHGPSACTLDLQEWGRAFHARDASAGTTRIEGFTIRNGYVGTTSLPAEYGGAIWFERPGAEIADCVFEDNFASFGGGAVACREGLVERCVFLGNRTDLSSVGNGGAMHVTTATPGGSGELVLRDCVFRGNAARTGGGLYQIGGARMSLSHCVFQENSAIYSGGGMLADGAWSMDDCLLAGNSAGSRGGAIDADAGILDTSSITGTTFTSNVANENGGAISIHTNTVLEIKNSILWGDSATFGAELALIYDAPFVSSTVLGVSFCDVAGGEAGVWMGTGTLNWGVGNLEVDPLFFDVDGADDDPLTFADNDYRLGTGSPCADAADNAAVPPDHTDIDGDGDTAETVPLDLLHRPRFADDASVPDTGNGPRPIVDMGACERPSATEP